MKPIMTAALAGLCAFTFARAQEPGSSALDGMVNAERAFAKAATQKGIRDSFLEYFADDAIAFNPSPVSATDRLRSRPGRPFSELELTWEPRMGDIAASGELGWLTGPSTFIDHTTAGAAPQPGNYLSVWRRRSSGPWRVFIDVGSQPPQAVSFAPGFTRFPMSSRYAGQRVGLRRDRLVAGSRQAAERADRRTWRGAGVRGSDDRRVTSSPQWLHAADWRPCHSNLDGLECSGHDGSDRRRRERPLR